jgi:hypothetical protein
VITSVFYLYATFIICFVRGFPFKMNPKWLISRRPCEESNIKLWSLVRHLFMIPFTRLAWAWPWPGSEPVRFKEWVTVGHHGKRRSIYGRCWLTFWKGIDPSKLCIKPSFSSHSPYYYYYYYYYYIILC